MKKGEKRYELPPPAKVLGDNQAIKFVIPGDPRTKKTHQRILKTRDGRPFLAPSAEWVAYEKDALARLTEFVSQLSAYLPIDYPVGIQALFFRCANVGDLTNYEQGLGDLLQNAGILADDKLIESWDGSRKLKDAANPRVEIHISRFGAAQESLAL
jgi:Holliday junction resolvase RusA-like endonuclease